MNTFDATAAAAILHELETKRRRVAEYGVFEYLKPLGDSCKKDVNKTFLAGTIRSVDLHNKRHEEDQCWRLKDLEAKHLRSRSRSRSRSRRRSRNLSSSDSLYHKRRKLKRLESCRSPSQNRHHEKLSTDDRESAISPRDSDEERLFWAQKKEKKAKKLWESMHTTKTTVMVDNAPSFYNSDSDNDDDNRITDEIVVKSKQKKKKDKKSKKDKKDKKSKKDKKEKKAKKVKKQY